MNTKIWLAMALSVGALFATSDGSALTPNRPTMQIKGATAPGVYTGGALDLDVVIESWGHTAATAVVTLDYGAGKATQTVAIPAARTSLQKTVKLTDPGGLTSGCAPRSYTVTLTSHDAAVGVGNETFTVTPSCQFSSKLVDEWNMIEPDRVDEQQKDAVYLTNAVLEVAPTCAAGPRIKASIANHTKVSSPSLIVQAKAGDVVKSQTAAAFPLAAGTYKEVVLTPVGAHEPAPKLDVVITDWTHGLGTRVHNHGITVTTTRSCTLSVAKVETAPPREVLH